MQNINLGRFLRVDVSGRQDITVQLLPDYSLEEEVLCCWDGEKLVCAIAADEQPGGYSDKEYWDGIWAAFQADPDNTVSVIKEGEYPNQDGSRLSYKIFKLQVEGTILRQIMCLIHNQQVAYWIFTVSINCEDIFLVNRLMSEILFSARIDPVSVVAEC